MLWPKAQNDGFRLKMFNIKDTTFRSGFYCTVAH